MRVQLDDDVDLEKAETTELLKELYQRIKAKSITLEEVVDYLDKGEVKEPNITTKGDLNKWLVFAGVK